MKFEEVTFEQSELRRGKNAVRQEARAIFKFSMIGFLSPAKYVLLGAMAVTAMAHSAAAITINSASVTGTQNAFGTAGTRCSQGEVLFAYDVNTTDVDVSAPDNPNQHDRFVIRVVDANNNIIASNGYSYAHPQYESTAFASSSAIRIGNSDRSADIVVAPTLRPFRLQIFESTTSATGVDYVASGAPLYTSATFDPFPLPGGVISGFSASACEGIPGGFSDDTIPPVVTVPDDIVVTANPNATTAIVTYPAPTAYDNLAGTIATTRIAGPSSGSTFSLGTTRVAFSATDSANNTSISNFYVTVNAPPTANAGPEQSVVSGTQVTLSGTGTDSDGNIASYQWSRTGGTGASGSATLSDSTQQNPTFTDNSLAIGDASVTHVFSLTTTDNNNGVSPPDTVTITITAPLDEETPVITPVATIAAEAGPDGLATVSFEAVVTDNYDSSINPVYTYDSTDITSPYDFPIGNHTVFVNAQDSAGNMAIERSFLVEVTGAVAPDAPVITISDINADRSLTIGGTAEAGAAVRVTFPDGTFVDSDAASGNFSATSAPDMQGGTVRVLATDGSGNESPEATVDLFPDYDRPTVAITGNPTRIVDTSPFTITVTFSEIVTGFSQTDIAVAGAAITAFSGTGATYTAEIAPIAGEAVSISVAAGVAEDAFANPNEASDVIVLENAALTETEEFVAQATLARNRALIAAQPQLYQFLRDSVQGAFNLQATQGSGNFNFSTSSDSPVWASGKGRWSTDGTLDSSYFHIATGAHFGVTPNLLLGAMAQFDSFKSDDGVGTFDGTGWLIGPYAVGRLPDQPLMFSASYLVGQAQNNASPLGTFEDRFQSDRTLLTVGVAGEFALDWIKLFPTLDLRRATDETDNYVAGDGFNVRTVHTTVSDVTLGMDFVMPLATQHGMLELIGGFGLTSSTTDNGAIVESASRGDVDLGIRYVTDSGATINVSGAYDGLGEDDYHSITASILVGMKF